MKSQKILGETKKEFDAIRHGNYDQFIELIKGPEAVMVLYNNGVIKTSNINQKEDFDFAVLIYAAPSLKLFYQKCISEYGKIIDPDLSDIVFERAALFEIIIRMHARNRKLLLEAEKLEPAIEKLCESYKLNTNEKEDLHNGRRFLNMIKHNKGQFGTWEEGVLALKNAFKVLTKHKLSII